jgi:hypothetical protein
MMDTKALDALTGRQLVFLLQSMMRTGESKEGMQEVIEAIKRRNNVTNT